MPTFPFGSKLKKVEQQNRSQKKVFILGVYASAVHAKWIDANEKIKVNALAVASEPYIFWRGDGVEKIIQTINKNISPDIGRLEVAHEKYNGPSGLALDEKYLRPLGITRDDCWLCDIIPFSRLNPNQKRAIDREYNPLIKNFNLPVCTIPEFAKTELNDDVRRREILEELKLSKADTIILLGDEPIKRFLSYYTDNLYQKLTDFGNSSSEYGKKQKLEIDGKQYTLIPLAHPRQVNKLGQSSQKWFDWHKKWTTQV
jgi:uracil-DNA glycosylase